MNKIQMRKINVQKYGAWFALLPQKNKALKPN